MLKLYALNRRLFIRNASLAGMMPLGFPALSMPSESEFSDVFESNDDELWSRVQAAYPVSATIINLNNGGVSPHPRSVAEALDTYQRMSNEAPSYYMWRILDRGRESLRESLATLAGCESGEIAIHRNATEALETIIFGLPLKAGDEIVCGIYDYPNMMNAWKQREMRDGIIMKKAVIPAPCESEKELIRAYTSLFSEKTKLVHLTHVINWNGQVLPVKEIAAEAKKRGIEVLVDGAHSFTHIQYILSELGCDYWGTSLHKWLSAPFGTGMMYIRKDKISKIWPLLAPEKPDSDDIRKFEALGTRSFPIEQAIGHAIRFHYTIGSDRKEKRLRYLRNYWLDRVKDLPGINIYSPLSEKFSSAITTIGFDGMQASEIEAKLFEYSKIHVTTIQYEKINGVRITPHVYTTLQDLDILIKTLNKISRKGQ
jgi:selenocysteine lyase/cysteine desulfurase